MAGITGHYCVRQNDFFAFVSAKKTSQFAKCKFSSSVKNGGVLLWHIAMQASLCSGL